jgi:hypothetical protein
VDIGEFVTPGYVHASLISGVIIRDHSHAPVQYGVVVNVTHADHPMTTTVTDLYPAPHIEFALLKYKVGFETVVLVADGVRKSGEKSFCMEKDENGEWVYCGREFYPFPRPPNKADMDPNPTPTFPVRTTEKVQVMGACLNAIRQFIYLRIS